MLKITKPVPHRDKKHGLQIYLLLFKDVISFAMCLGGRGHDEVKSISTDSGHAPSLWAFALLPLCSLRPQTHTEQPVHARPPAGFA